jgi:hypothetical protein
MCLYFSTSIDNVLIYFIFIRKIRLLICNYIYIDHDMYNFPKVLSTRISDIHFLGTMGKPYN